MNQLPGQPTGETEEKRAWLTPKEYTDPAEKKKDFWIGVGLFFGLNIVLGICFAGASVALSSAAFPADGSGTAFSDLYSILSCILSLLPWLINIGLMLYFAFTRSQIALGMLAGFGAALLITICVGVIFAAYCFYLLSNSGA